MQLTQIILEAALILIFGLSLILFRSYFSEKGKNLATVEDIKAITKKVEEVKAEIEQQQLVVKQKRDLKYHALLNALTLIDAHYSQLLAPSPGQKIKRQYATTEEARRCHNELILTAENMGIIQLFNQIMFEAGSKQQTEPPTVLLNRFRNLIREELGFGEKIPLNEDKAWFGYFAGEK